MPTPRTKPCPVGLYVCSSNTPPQITLFTGKMMDYFSRVVQGPWSKGIRYMMYVSYAFSSPFRNLWLFSFLPFSSF